MLQKIARFFTGDPNKKAIDKLSVIVDKINTLEPQFEGFSDEALAAKTDEYKARLAKGETLDDLLPEAFATVREASKRVLGQRHYDVQLICGINLHNGSISELRTGEGKTLSATLPLYLNALEGKGAHLITVNDYLARRDGRWMGAIYRFLGMSTGILQSASASDGATQRAFIYDPDESSLYEETHQLRPVHRKHAYAADITYGTNSEFGFDYLRDNITMRWDDRVQKPHHFAIIDEVDNILIDEARTPLIISGPSHEDSENYYRMAKVVKALQPEDVEVSEKDQSVALTEIGVAHVEELLGEPLSDPERPEDINPEQARLMGFLEQSLRAEYLFHRNKEYIVQGGEVIIVDEFTGRMMPGRRWSDGLHQAVEAKEGVKVEAENITHATVTIQNYFRMYKKLAGMTGTAMTEKEEFYRIYGLDVLAIPSNLEYKAEREDSGIKKAQAKDEFGYEYTYYYADGDESQEPLYYKRMDYPDVIFRTVEGKLRAIVLEILRYHAIGRPQLVGTTSVDSSERLSERLSSEMVRRVVQVSLIRRAWRLSKGAKEEDYQHAPELVGLNEPLNKLRMPELRRLGNQFGMSTMDLSDESNREGLLELLNLEPQHWERLKPTFDAGIPHQVLNARKHTEESLIIAKAGAIGAVTIATNMAGRGVDIKLGGELPENLLSELNQILAKHSDLDPYNMTMPQRLAAVNALNVELDEDQQAAVDAFKEYMEQMALVRELGGLHVIGSERHEARRIDNQLRGRAGRQGDPGSSRFYLSMDDELMRLFGGEQMESMLSRFKLDESMPIEIGIINKMVEQAQTRVEGSNFDVRKHLLEYDDVLNSQRNRVYEQRDRIFLKEDLHDDVSDMIRNEVAPKVSQAMADAEGPWKLLAQLEDIQSTITTEFGIFPSYTFKMVANELEDIDELETLKERLLDVAQDAVKQENAHILEGVEVLLARNQETIKNQIAERSEALDAFLETYDPENGQDAQAELSSLMGVQVRLGATEQKMLRDDPMSMKQPLRDALRTGVTLNILRRTLLTLEKRFNESWPFKAIDLASQPWAETQSKLLDQAQDTLKYCYELLFGDNGEVTRDIESNEALLEEALEDEEALYKAIQMTTIGKRVGFDPRSRQRQFRAHMRLNYIFSMAEKLKKMNPEELTEDILGHLNDAEEHLAEIFGMADWMNIRDKNRVIADTHAASRKALAKELGEAQYEAVAKQPLDEIPEELHKSIQDVLGYETQNRVYRDLLLGTFTEQWVEYLTEMEALRVSIRMESYAQRDPLIQYKHKASGMYSELMNTVRQTVVSRMFRFRPNLVSAQDTGTKTASGSESASAGKAKKKRRRRR
jgi:preprotein translocase subunit SecA